ncbi:phage protein Gp27 family protein [Granulicella cerasi]|uniref:Phage protein Gp27 family protein n=1 Tax=Granulicella cerasi TaxID=741063 RepID=A0ABW1Z8L9_9BACT|nr:phage protein Gp27 family protein [Granulicella cerasi]
MAKSHPKTGDTRKTRQPLSIDRLTPDVHEAILGLRNRDGKTWEEIERFSAEPCGKGKLGFVQWTKQSADALQAFPHKRIPKSNLHRWYDIRIAQVQEQTLQASEQARVLAASFAKAAVDDGDEATINAIRDTLFSVLGEDMTTKGRERIAKSMLDLAQVQIKAKAAKLLERRVAVDEQSLQMKIDEFKRKTGQLLKDAEEKQGDAPVMTREQVLNRVKEIYGVGS